MKKHLILLLAALIGISSCATDGSMERGMTGAYIGTMFGSIVGDIVGGYHGSHVGALVGGAVGAAAGVASAKAEQNARKQHYDSRQDSYDGGDYDNRYYDNSISYGNGRDYTYIPPANPTESLEVRNILFADDNGNRVLEPKEQAYISFDIYNRSGQPIYNVSPIVVCDNKRIEISPTATIAAIDSGKGMRYRCVVRAKKNIQPGTSTFNIGFAQQGYTTSFAKRFSIRIER